MQKTKRFKTYPFPFLADYTSDYKKTDFTLDITYRTEDKNVVIQPQYHLNNPQLQELIANKDLKVVVKIRCRTMGLSFTEEFVSRYNTMQLNFDPMDLDGDVEVTAYLVAATSFKLQNDDFSELWKGETPIIEKDNVIGETNERTLTINHLKAGASKSIFKFTRVVSKEPDQPFGVSLDDNECIVFLLSEKMFRQFSTIKEKAREYIYGAFVIPALADILRQMSIGDLEENEFNIKHGNKKWFQVLFDNYGKAFNGANPTEGTINPLEAAQTIIDKYAIINLLAEGVKKTKGIK